jgi:hypothetical protein
MRLAAQRKINNYRQNNTLTIRTFLFSPPSSAPSPCTTKFCVFFFYRPTGRLRRTSMPLECHRNARGILPVAEAQSRSRGGQSSGITDQPQCRGLWHSSSPSARSLSRSPSSPPPPFTQSPSPPRSLVRDGQASPHRPRLVVSHSTCPPISPSPHAHSLLIGTAVINTHATLEFWFRFPNERN